MTLKSLTAILLLCFSPMFSQEKLHEIKLNLPDKSYSIRIIDEENKQVTLLTSTHDSIIVHKFDSNFKIIDSLKTETPFDIFNFISGHSVDENNLKLFWMTNDDKRLLSKTYNYHTKEIIENDYDLVFENEIIIQRFIVNKKFYILSLVKNTSLLKFHIFSDNGKHEIKEVDFSGLSFYGKKTQEKNFYKILTGSAFEAWLNLTTITNDKPASLLLGKRKLYINEKNITFSFDINPMLTQLFTIDLVDFSFKEEQVQQPNFELSESSTPKSNSFLINDKLFQIKLTSEKLVLNITDSDRTKSKQFEAIPDNEITFNNSEMTQEDGSTNKLIILEKTNQFIRKTNNYDCAVSSFVSGDNYVVTLGSRIYIDSGSSSVAPMYGAVGALISVALTHKSNVYNPNPYKSYRVVYTHCLFDKNLNHIEDKVQKTAFDMARIYADNLKNQTNTTFFKFNSMMYIGSFDKNLKKYTFKGFAD